MLLADGSDRMSPNKWAERAIALYDKHSASRIIGEVNNGGDLVWAITYLVNRRQTRIWI